MALSSHSAHSRDGLQTRFCPGLEGALRPFQMHWKWELLQLFWLFVFLLKKAGDWEETTLCMAAACSRSVESKSHICFWGKKRASCQISKC